MKLLNQRGLLIGFTEAIQPTTLTDMTVQLYVAVSDPIGWPGSTPTYRWTWLQVAPTPVAWSVNCNTPQPAGNPVRKPTNGPFNAVQILPGAVKLWPNGQYLVVLRGDAILALDESQPTATGASGPRALDGNHLAPGLVRTGPRRCPTGDLIEGGTFESWFKIVNSDASALRPARADTAMERA